MTVSLKKTGIFCLFFISMFIPACSDDNITAEDEVKLYITNAQLAAENRNHSDLADLIDKDYRDHKGLNKKQIIEMARAYFFTHKNIYLFTQIQSIDFQQENTAFVTVYVAMAGTLISDINALSSLRARIYKFELLLIKNNEWLLQQAKWQRAALKDML